MMVGIGHNSGFVAEPGQAWRTHVWRKARTDLLPRLPIEIVRRRVKRAAALGLPYKTYAGIRASSGHDLIGFLFSSNALRVLKDGQRVPQDRCAALNALKDCKQIGLVHRPIRLDAVTPPMAQSYPAPAFAGTWSDMRDHLRDIIYTIGTPADRFVLIGETATEREWAGAIKAAGYLSGDAYFSAAAGFPSQTS